MSKLTEEQFEAYLAAGVEDVLYVSINSGGSNTHSAALMARQNFMEEHPARAGRVLPRTGRHAHAPALRCRPELAHP